MGVGTSGRISIGCIIKIYIVTTFDVALDDMFVRLWFAKTLEVLVDAATLVICRIVSLEEGAFGR